MADYFVMTGVVDDEHCAIYDQNPSFEEFAGPALGREMGSAWPDGLEYSMSTEEPGLAVGDVINNALGYLMVSGRVKDLLTEHASADIEWLRFTLLNHKGRVASDDVWVANVLSRVACVDRDRTDGSPHPTHPERYFSIYSLHLEEDRIDPTLNLFRLSEMPEVMVVRDDLKAVLEGEGVTGAAFFGMGEEVDL